MFSTVSTWIKTTTNSYTVKSLGMIQLITLPEYFLHILQKFRPHPISCKSSHSVPSPILCKLLQKYNQEKNQIAICFPLLCIFSETHHITSLFFFTGSLGLPMVTCQVKVKITFHKINKVTTNIKVIVVQQW